MAWLIRQTTKRAYTRVGETVLIYENGRRRAVRATKLAPKLLEQIPYSDPEDFPFVEWFGGRPYVIK